MINIFKIDEHLLDKGDFNALSAEEPSPKLPHARIGVVANVEKLRKNVQQLPATPKDPKIATKTSSELRIYVGNLRFAVLETKLREMFVGRGLEVSDITIFRGNPQGVYAQVQFCNEQDYSNALNCSFQFDGQELDLRPWALRSLSTKSPAVKANDNSVKESGQADSSTSVKEQVSVASLEYEEGMIVSDSENVNTISAPEAVSNSPTQNAAKRSLKSTNSTEEGVLDPRRNQTKKQKIFTNAEVSVVSSVIAESTKDAKTVDVKGCSKQVLDLLEHETDNPNKLTDFIQTLMSSDNSFKIGMATSLFHVCSQQKQILRLLGDANAATRRTVVEDKQEEAAPPSIPQTESVANEVLKEQPEESTQKPSAEEPWLSFGEL